MSDRPDRQTGRISDRATERGLRAELVASIRFGPGVRAFVFLALAFVGPAAALWAAGLRVADAKSQWIMTLGAVGGVAFWALRTSKFKLNTDGIARRRLGRFEMWLWSNLAAIEESGGSWTVRGPKGGVCFRFTRWTGNARHLADLISFAIDEARRQEPDGGEAQG